MQTRKTFAALAALSLALAVLPAAAQRGGASELSALSMLPLAVSVAAPVAVLASGTVLTVVAMQAVSDGTVWVLERASDGARVSLNVSGTLAGGASLAVGSGVMCLALSSGWLLTSAGKAMAYLPNELGRALLHEQRITP